MKLVRITTLAVVLVALTGCESIGEGSTLKSLELQVSATGANTGPFVISRCLRDQLIAIATFTDGTRSDFSYRATWTSSDPSIVQVSNNELPTVLAVNGAFIDAPGSFYRPGTVIPRAASGTATITANFLGISSSMDVTISTPVFKAAPVAPGVNPHSPPALTWLGPSTTQRFGFLAVLADGRSQTLGNLNALGFLNPVMWRFVGGVNDPADGTSGDFDKSAVPNAETPDAVVSSDGVVTAKATAVTPTYTVEAVTSLCPDDSAFRPTADVRVAPFGNGPSGFPLTLSHEPDFNGPGVAPTGDLVAGTIEFVRVTGHLDTNGDGIGDETQDLSTQIDMDVTHTTTCTTGTTNCTCDADGSNCTKRLVLATGRQVQTLINNDNADATIFACQNDSDADHLDDCEESAANEGTSRRSNTLDIHAIAVNLTGADASIVIQPSAPAPEPALTYPGRQFETFGTFKALAGTPFAGGTSDTATQKLTQIGIWTTRPAGSTTEFSSVGFVRSVSDGLWGPTGSFAYAKDVTENTNVDIYFDGGNVISSVADPAPVTFTICPSSGC
jgi:hypothetical protein